MPRGTCETCDEHDTFLHGAPSAGRKIFVCVRCLALHYESDQRQAEDGDVLINSAAAS
jgi:hypothetical protein